MAEEENPTGVQAVVEHLDGRLSGSRVEVDQNVTAENGVCATEDARPVLVKQVHLAKMTELANRFGDVPAIGTLVKVGASRLDRGRPEAALAVDAATQRREISEP